MNKLYYLVEVLAEPGIIKVVLLSVEEGTTIQQAIELAGDKVSGEIHNVTLMEEVTDLEVITESTPADMYEVVYRIEDAYKSRFYIADSVAQVISHLPANETLIKVDKYNEKLYV